MTYRDEELLVSRPPLSQERRPYEKRGLPSRSSSSPYIRIECQAEERHFVDSTPFRMNSLSKPIRFTTHETLQPEQFRSEIVVHSNPATDFYIKRLRVAFHDHPAPSIHGSKTLRSSSSPRSHLSQEHPQDQRKANESTRKFRSRSLPRSNSQAMLHRWIDDICSNEQLMGDDDIVFFLKNGEFLARI
jgi:hypothetical protein